MMGTTVTYSHNGVQQGAWPGAYSSYTRPQTIDEARADNKAWLDSQTNTHIYQAGQQPANSITVDGLANFAPATPSSNAPATAASPVPSQPATGYSTQAQRDNTTATAFANYQAPAYRPAATFQSALGSGPADLSAPAKLGSFASALGDGSQPQAGQRPFYGTDNYYSSY